MFNWFRTRTNIILLVIMLVLVPLVTLGISQTVGNMNKTANIVATPTRPPLCLSDPLQFDYNQKGNIVVFTLDIPSGVTWQMDFGDGLSSSILYNNISQTYEIRHEYKNGGEYQPALYTFDYKNNCSNGAKLFKPIHIDE